MFSLFILFVMHLWPRGFPLLVQSHHLFLTAVLSGRALRNRLCTSSIEVANTFKALAENVKTDIGFDQTIIYNFPLLKNTSPFKCALLSFRNAPECIKECTAHMICHSCVSRVLAQPHIEMKTTEHRT